MEGHLSTLPPGIQLFVRLRQGAYLDVDKTQEMRKLLQAGKFLFLARRRCFGMVAVFVCSAILRRICCVFAIVYSCLLPGGATLAGGCAS